MSAGIGVKKYTLNQQTTSGMHLGNELDLLQK